jgi:two-component sensor histidine kinase
MELYRKKSWWKIALAVAGVAIIAVTMVYTNYLSRRMADNERMYIEFYSQALKSMTSGILNFAEEGDFSIMQERAFDLELVILSNIKNPIILDDGTDSLTGFNWGHDLDNDQSFLLAQKIKLQKSGIEPLLPTYDTTLDLGAEFFYPKIYYRHSKLYQLITWFPLIQVGMIALFIVLGYFMFSSIKRGEQNRVWVGMAKETAHQLGTPITGIMGWTEYLKSMTTLTSEQHDAVDELENDVKKLDLIADRFSKIGSVPILEKHDINAILLDSILYMKKRSPKNIVYRFDQEMEAGEMVMINNHLFSWVIENLFRNALDAMEDRGEIRIETSSTNKSVTIDISDTGKGIPQGWHKRVFEPGFSTKKRGWGLGLSLARRIIGSYHKGKIIVLRSKQGEGTTFRISLPRVY